MNYQHRRWRNQLNRWWNVYNVRYAGFYSSIKRTLKCNRTFRFRVRNRTLAPCLIGINFLNSNGFYFFLYVLDFFGKELWRKFGVTSYTVNSLLLFFILFQFLSLIFYILSHHIRRWMSCSMAIIHDCTLLINFCIMVMEVYWHGELIEFGRFFSVILTSLSNFRLPESSLSTNFRQFSRQLLKWLTQY
jgi:hypothetical protein